MPTTYIRTLQARSHAATHRTQLLLSRCRLAAPERPEMTDQAPVTPTPPITVQAAWHARQQQNFLTWLDRGGLAQEREQGLAQERQQDQRKEQGQEQETVAAIGNSGIGPLFPALVKGADEELQFSQVRVRDAVR